MSIAKMDRLRIVAMRTDRERLMHELMLLGCVHVSEFEPQDAEEDGLAGLVRAGPGSDSGLNERLNDGRQDQELVEAALAAVDKYDDSKKKLFSPPTETTAVELFDDAALSEALSRAREIAALMHEMDGLYADKSRLEAQCALLDAWTPLDIPLDIADTASVSFLFGTIPAQVKPDAVREVLAESAPACELILASSSHEQHCVFVICHKADLSAAMQALRQYGFARVSFGVTAMTAAQALEDAQSQLERIGGEGGEIERLQREVGAYASARAALRLASDRLMLDREKNLAEQSLGETGSTFILEGWSPVTSRDRLEKLFGKFCCAYEFSEPEPDDDVPVRLVNNRLTEPYFMVTEMYSLPKYGNIDPNALIMPFFSVFFGIMYADIGYGAVLALIGILIKKMFRPRRTMKHMSGLAIQCGITTIIFGILFGSCFGDAIPVVSEMFGHRIDLWTLVNPLEDPMTILIGSLVLGFIQIVFGMGVKAYILIRDGHPLDALFDVGSWWLLFAGIGVGALGGGWYVAIAGALALILTQGRAKPTFIGKIVGGISSLYDITSYFGDVLSYSRLMALLLATCVIASVINTLGSMTGFLFPIVFIAGHGFNMAINVIGTFVHSARLQYLEFFKTFYEDGGKPFSPLSLDSAKYVYVSKEENRNG